ncbi:hypothetical protein DMA12_22940 [Amycolatopsis balhimycina DSM 5908]|uniref:DUF3592 domain-containing protein n=1 Tax=Amycolatopsis balhimycina DSM 5908 TaxID=1081091 RepID=A0A428WFH7_AMYBA|nr:hypothetical protein [Amycolatopsis balhimycina]RSM41812.1 hypothetical protein DMA12_22940 [Amycolatopsis balhimycina DSM 5908]
MKTRWDPDGPGWQPDAPGAPVTPFSMACLAIALVSFVGLMFLGVTLRDRAGSVVAPATVERVLDLDRVVARVDGPAGRSMDVRTPTSYDRHTRIRTGRGYLRGSRIEVRYWPGKSEDATDTAGEVRLPGNWIFAVAGGGLLLGIAGLLVPTWPLKPRSK